MFSCCDIKIIKRLEKYDWCNDAILISVKNGRAVLKKELYDSYYAITLNKKPLVECKLSQCPTCADMLATGYGIDESSPELNAISQAINSEFISLDKSIQDIKPLLGLLADGFYVIADIPCYPTDGENNFFWNVSDNSKTVLATTEYYNDELGVVQGRPLFIYPSQSTDSFNEQRVQHYIKTIANENAPRAIAYYIIGFISLLLDGHHKATAAALCKKPINCLTIIPMTAYQARTNGEVYFSRFKVEGEFIPHAPTLKIKRVKKSFWQVAHKNIIKREWEEKYLLSSDSFPTIEEIAHQERFKINEITDKLIDQCLQEITPEVAKKLAIIISMLSRQDDSRMKNVAIKCANLRFNSPQLNNLEPQDLNRLREVAFKALSKIKDDKQIQQLFIDVLVDSEENCEALKIIASRYL